MKDYSTMDDLEINQRVFFWRNGEIKECKGLAKVADGHISYLTTLGYVRFDPCNNPADAWPIILENKINIDHRDTFKAGPMASMSGRKDIYAVDKNPLRASMIVFLMMKDDAVNTQGEKV
ncbi:phage protein NinX family protein [Ewingella americana]|uniref:phage protein NinX family protein n=1 Tax=Ewingella americana TaxID=41202 RepID=UPI0012AE262D|nr:phage protein NinX family protein [Ewingella americana]MRT01930.1 DUF2591 domain-containing protein [Ewingella americana]